MTEYVKAWQCIGCGKIKAPQTCMGVCADWNVQFACGEHAALPELMDMHHRVGSALCRARSPVGPAPGQAEGGFIAQHFGHAALQLVGRGVSGHHRPQRALTLTDRFYED